jgi:hypothetical protein
MLSRTSGTGKISIAAHRSRPMPRSWGTGNSGERNGRSAAGSRRRRMMSEMWMRMYAVAQPSTPARMSSMNVSPEAASKTFIRIGMSAMTAMPTTGARVEGSR